MKKTGELGEWGVGIRSRPFQFQERLPRFGRAVGGEFGANKLKQTKTNRNRSGFEESVATGGVGARQATEIVMGIG